MLQVTKIQTNNVREEEPSYKQTMRGGAFLQTNNVRKCLPTKKQGEQVPSYKQTM